MGTCDWTRAAGEVRDDRNWDGSVTTSAGERVPGFVGRPLPGVEAKIVSWSEDGGDYTTLAEADHDNVSDDNSESGELLIKGPNVFKEYHNKPEATRKEFTEDGWFKTGDTAKVIINLYYHLLKNVTGCKIISTFIF